MARVNVEDLLAGKLKRPLVEYSHAYVQERRNTNNVWLVPADYYEQSVWLISERSLTEAWAIKDEVDGLLKAMRRLRKTADGTQ